jgi:GT2 family glycosyltransferase
MPIPDLSVIIVSYNTRDQLRDCLLSLRRAAGEARFEVIVVDNASKDGSAEMVRADFPEVQRCASSQNEGFAAAMNRGIPLSQAEYFLALNPDTFMTRATIPKLLNFMKEHPKAGIAGARLTFPDGTDQPSTFCFPSLFKEFWNALPELKSVLKLRKISEILSWNRTKGDGRTEIQVECVSGAALIARKSVVESVGGFDSNFFLYHEERDLCERIRQAGWEIWFVPGTQVIHFDAQASGYRQSRLPEWPVLEWRTLGMSRLWEKHKSQSAHRLWSLQTRFLFSLRAVLLSLTQVFRGAKGRERGRRRIEELRRVIGLLKSE